MNNDNLLEFLDALSELSRRLNIAVEGGVIRETRDDSRRYVCDDERVLTFE